MLEPDWLIGQYERGAGIVNEAGILRLRLTPQCCGWPPETFGEENYLS